MRSKYLYYYSIVLTFMNTTNAYLVKPKLNFLNQCMLWIGPQYRQLIYPDHYLYIPKKLVIGLIKKVNRKTNNKLDLDKNNIFYSKSTKTLELYEKKLNENELEIVRYLSIPDTVIDAITEEYKTYKNSKNNLINIIKDM